MIDGLDKMLPARDVVIRYSRRELRQYIIRDFVHMTPVVLHNLIHNSILPVNQLRQLVEELLGAHCFEFANHSKKWEYSTNNSSILTRMMEYDGVWDGFASSEPWFAAANKRISYFLDINYVTRLREIELEFYN